MRPEKQRKVAENQADALTSLSRIRQELQDILENDQFRATPKRREMLKFLVEETLADRKEALKGYAIGLAVFGRDESFDPQTDPVVRLEARRLRHDLDSYYIARGGEGGVRISIPKGQYAPKFHEPPESLHASETAPQDAASSPRNAVPLPGPTWLAWSIALGTSAIALLLLGAMIASYLPVPRREPLDKPTASFRVISVPADANTTGDIRAALNLPEHLPVYFLDQKDLSKLSGASQKSLLLISHPDLPGGGFALMQQKP
ncbi:hypothetical protein [Roseibium suaedae]|uniref:Uncharacterized protein n=1 Tax=Roseibium suaedae TaxID=735517 RepID=A0A1M7NQY8_9HYPH|nr:hypothetical protein [Roseibium suaedae]SHN06282.1 hypothetical protein SAMN05444272_3910 [Roseibium suaedae]